MAHFVQRHGKHEQVSVFKDRVRGTFCTLQEPSYLSLSEPTRHVQEISTLHGSSRPGL